MKQIKNPNTHFEIQIGEKGKLWTTNLWIVAHGGSGLFPSSGELFFFEIVLLRCVLWWRFGQAKDGTTQRRKQRARRELFLPRNRSAPAICVAMVEVRRELWLKEDVKVVVEVKAWRKGWRRELWLGFFLFCLESIVLRGLLSGKVVFSTWQILIDRRKTLVLRQLRI